MEMDYRIVRKLEKLGNLPRKPRARRIFKTLLTLLLIISWTLTGLPQIPFINFPPKIKEAQATWAFVANRGTANETEFSYLPNSKNDP